ncbi:ATP-binding SpoIIE family protein phosphatase [Thiocystis violacea]|uniref:ATP-binding SpoIIE family protein phosphatase n=1 Tax=Thiocystis violacea TaxID=13725 RepID=UPI001908F62E|nr:SpoIIE family protein phosphatase [Thiocystis violacea]MBK1722861.1 serine/threonine protein phosphatase [Thiocystis violacea]
MHALNASRDLPAPLGLADSGPRWLGRRGYAMIVEPDPRIAEVMVPVLAAHACGCLVLTTAEEAIARFEAERPDIVFVGTDLPGLDGFEATRLIKALAGDRFVPVILTAHQRDEALLLRCIESGADDFLLKPFRASALRARILVMERVCGLQQRMSERNQTVAALLERERMEQALAERVLDRAVKGRNVVMDQIGMVFRPAAIFSGDIVLTQHLPNGALRLLIGDFTGHGLAAAVAALPVADAFHAMTRKGVSDAQVLAELNRKLYQLLPADRFMAAILVTIPANCEELRWWNGGMPSGWLKTSGGLRELTAHALPLGILPDLPLEESPRRVRLSRGDHLLLMTDGLLEAHDREERMFVTEGFPAVLDAWREPESGRILPALCQALDLHGQGAEQLDDIAVLDIPIETGLFGTPAPVSDVPMHSGWTLTLELEGERLQIQPTLESMLGPLGLVDGLRKEIVVLETILTELYANALEHGVLKLDSTLKATPEGFDAFYKERARRLGDACSGSVSIQVDFEPSADGGSVRMQVRDSGEGFREADTRALALDTQRPWGRGIPLLRQLCESVRFHGDGSRAEVVYRWPLRPDPLRAGRNIGTPAFSNQ